MLIDMERWMGKVAVVTGASVGIGACIAEHLVKQGLKVVGIARRVDKIEDLAKKLSGEKGKLFALKGDVTVEEEILTAFKWITTNVGPIHIIVNNAGIIQQTSLVEGDTDKWKQIFNTNVIGLCIATREAVKDMKANNIDGHIIHINSIAGHMVPNIPGINVYPASKYAVTALTETLRLELNAMRSKIKVTSISPGAVSTEISQTNNYALDSNFIEFYKSMPLLNPEDIADAVLYVLSTPPHVQIHELLIKPVNEAI